MKLLVAKDGVLSRHHLYIRLGERGHMVGAVPDAEETFYRVSEYHHDLAVIDLGLPGMNGLDLVRELRPQGKSFPILILTARGNWQDKVESLAAGADNYVVKPFQFKELEARLNAPLRRFSGFIQPTIGAGSLVLNLNRKQVLAEEQPVAPTAYEYRIPGYLMWHHQQMMTKECLMGQLYPDSEKRDANATEALVGHPRCKLETYGDFKPIDTVRSQGYLFTECYR